MYAPNYAPYLDDAMSRLHMGPTYDSVELEAQRKAAKAYQKTLLKANPFEQEFGMPIVHPSLGYGMCGGKVRNPMWSPGSGQKKWIMDRKDYTDMAAMYRGKAVDAPARVGTDYRVALTKKQRQMELIQRLGFMPKYEEALIQFKGQFPKAAIRQRIYQAAKDTLGKGVYASGVVARGMFKDPDTKRWKKDKTDFEEMANKMDAKAASYKFPTIPEEFITKRNRFNIKLREAGKWEEYRAAYASAKADGASKYELRKLQMQYRDQYAPTPLDTTELAKVAADRTAVAKGLLQALGKRIGVKKAGKFVEAELKPMPHMRGAYKLAAMNAKTMYPGMPVRKYLRDIAMAKGLPIYGHKTSKLRHIVKPMVQSIAKMNGVKAKKFATFLKSKELQQPISAGFIGTIAKILTSPMTKQLVKKTAQFVLPKAAKWLSGLSRKHLGVDVAVTPSESANPTVLPTATTSMAVTKPEPIPQTTMVDDPSQIAAAAGLGPNTADEFTRAGRMATRVYNMAKN